MYICCNFAILVYECVIDADHNLPLFIISMYGYVAIVMTVIIFMQHTCKEPSNVVDLVHIQHTLIYVLFLVEI